MCQRRKVERVAGYWRGPPQGNHQEAPSKGKGLVEREILTQPVDNKINDQVIATQAK